MIGIVLAAGFGTRMGELTRTCPKPLLPVAGRPILEFLIDQLIGFPGLRAIHVVTNARYHARFLAWQREWQSKFADMPLHVHNDGIANAEDRLEMAGDLRFVLQHVPTPDGAVVTAGDNIYRFKLLPFWERFCTCGTNLVLAMPEHDVESLRQTGVLELGDHDRVLRFHEKPTDPPSHWKCPALYFLTRSALTTVRDVPVPAARHLVSHILAHDDIFVAEAPTSCLQVGTASAYEAADRIVREEGVWNHPPDAHGRGK